MPAPKRLRPDDRHFFRIVSRIAVTNPFSDERERLDEELLGRGASRTDRAPQLMRRLIPRLRKLDQAGPASWRDYEGEDGEVLRYVFLFDVFHRHVEDFDRLIEAQAASAGEPVPVPFAASALERLRARGFDGDEALQFFALCWQLRRAYHFIEQSLAGRSRSMRELRCALWNNTFTFDIRLYGRWLRERMEDFSTLLLGETGTGKGSSAAAIGRSGYIPFDARKGRFVESFTRAFMPLNLSEFPEGLIESELFGHRKGAFTGAVDEHEGLLSRCSPYGSVFLDEIGEVGVSIQIKLLQVLQERSYSPVGSHERKRFRGRVIAATNRGLRELREGGRFRDDFFYRLCSDVIVVPPLRQRLSEDPRELDLLIAHTLERMLGEAAPDLEVLAREVIDRSLGEGYAWPGNVRELEQCVRRVILKRGYDGDPAAAAGHGDPGAGDSGPGAGGGHPLAWLQSRLLEGELDLAGLDAAWCAHLFRRHGSYEAVARVARLDRRTVKKHVEAWELRKGR